jgi:hypothetical protein
MSGHIACIAAIKRCIQHLIRKFDRLSNRTRHRRDDNIKINLNETRLTGLIWLRIGSSGSSCEQGNELHVP